MTIVSPRSETTAATRSCSRYFLHKDLQGSTNIVTDPLGNTFQHQEYFPGGEVWFAENSTVFRTPFQYGGGYVDEVRALDNFGDRWYDPIREMMYSPDPVLTDDPIAIVTTPSLRAAYAFAGSNAVANIDPSGRQFTPAQRKAFIKANFKQARAIVAKDPALRASLEANLKTQSAEVVRPPRPRHRVGRPAPEAVQHDRRHRQAVRRDQHLHRRGQVEPRSLQAVHCEEGEGDTSNAATQPATSNQAGATNASGGPAVSALGSGGGFGSRSGSVRVRQRRRGQ